MSTRLTHWAAQRLERGGRRKFLASTAVFGSAMVVAPKKFALRPGTAYAAVCNCNGKSCNCSQLCCDGYTEFCCTIYDDNDCPPGTIVAGWWKADGSGYCDDNGPKPRYYLDCNAACSPGCGCGSAGVCASSCTSCSGRGTCANSNCNNRKTCRTLFRYGQCNNDVACVGPIVCRVVTCTPPWAISKFDCNATPATDNNTRTHHRPCLLESDPTDGLVPRDAVFVPGVWTSDAVAGPAYFLDGRWTIRTNPDTGPADLTFDFGIAGDIPIVGDWNGDGIDGIGVIRNGREWHLRNDLSSGPAEIVFSYGRPGDIPIVGDWNGDGIDEPGIVRDGRMWYLRRDLSGGNASITFSFGQPGDIPVSGDWDGDGIDEPGVVRNDTDWFLRTEVDGGPADISFSFGQAGDVPVVAPWGGGVPGPATVRGGSTWSYRTTPTGGSAEGTFEFPGDAPTTVVDVFGNDDTVASSE